MFRIENGHYFTIADYCQNDEGSAAIWQWILQNEDGSVPIKGEQFICKKGDGYDLAPECPWSACMDDEDGDCSGCKSRWSGN